MEYAYAALLLSESAEELNEGNLRSVLEAGNCTVSESRVKALVAALEGVDVDAVGPERVEQLTEQAPTETETEIETESPMEAGAATDSADGDTTEDIGDESG